MPTLGAPRYPARPGNEHALALRREASESAMRDLCSWMKEVCTEPQALRNADGSPRTVPPSPHSSGRDSSGGSSPRASPRPPLRPQSARAYYADSPRPQLFWPNYQQVSSY